MQLLEQTQQMILYQEQLELLQKAQEQIISIIKIKQHNNLQILVKNLENLELGDLGYKELILSVLQ